MQCANEKLFLPERILMVTWWHLQMANGHRPSHWNQHTQNENNNLQFVAVRLPLFRIAFSSFRLIRNAPDLAARSLFLNAKSLSTHFLLLLLLPSLFCRLPQQCDKREDRRIMAHGQMCHSSTSSTPNSLQFSQECFSQKRISMANFGEMCCWCLSWHQIHLCDSVKRLSSGWRALTFYRSTTENCFCSSGINRCKILGMLSGNVFGVGVAVAAWQADIRPGHNSTCYILCWECWIFTN